jgi:hypothetical protein
MDLPDIPLLTGVWPVAWELLIMAYNPEEFVNRETEIGSFRRVLGHPSQRIFLVCGAEGMGKTDVLARLRQECRQSGLKPVLLDFRGDDELSEPEQVIERLRERIGGDFAAMLGNVVVGIMNDFYRVGLTDLVAALSQGASSSVQITDARDLHIEGDIVGGTKVVLQNSSVVVNPAGGPNLKQRELKTRLNTVLPEALRAEVAGQKLVICLDHVDEATQPVASWVRHQVLRLLLEEADAYTNLWIVVVGREVPLRERADELRHLLYLQEVGPLVEEAIRIYWIEKRHLGAEQLAEVIVACRGNALALTRRANAEEVRRDTGYVHA